MTNAALQFSKAECELLSPLVGRQLEAILVPQTASLHGAHDLTCWSCSHLSIKLRGREWLVIYAQSVEVESGESGPVELFVPSLLWAPQPVQIEQWPGGPTYEWIPLPPAQDSIGSRLSAVSIVSRVVQVSDLGAGSRPFRVHIDSGLVFGFGAGSLVGVEASEDLPITLDVFVGSKHSHRWSANLRPVSSRRPFSARPEP